jgi:hypothetical protein
MKKQQSCEFRSRALADFALALLRISLPRSCRFKIRKYITFGFTHFVREIAALSLNPNEL